MKKAGTRSTRQGGFALNVEYMLFVAILVMGLLVGWVTLRDSVNAELVDTANAIEGSITFYYFNDPERGLGGAFDPAILEFCQSAAEEGGVIDPDLQCGPNAGSVLPEGPPGGSVSPIR